MRRCLLLVLLALAAVTAAPAAGSDLVMRPTYAVYPYELVTETLDGVVTAELPVPVSPAEVSPLPDGGAVFEGVEPGLEGIWIVHPGSAAVRLTTGALDDEPTATPDGSNVAFRRWVDATKSSDIYLVNGDGTGLKRLADSGGIAELGTPQFSADGSTIAYTCRPSSLLWPPPAPCGPQLDGSYWTNGIVLMNADGTDKRLIFRANAFSNSWSPDGQWMVTTADRVVSLGGNLYSGITQMFAIRTDGSDLFADAAQKRLLKVSDDPNALVPFGGSFSPDGNRILFGAAVPADNADHTYIIDRDGSNMHQLPLLENGVVFLPPFGGSGPPPTIDATHITVPPVRGLSFKAARKRLRARHLEIDRVSKLFSSTVPRGRVVAIRPRAGRKAHRFSEAGAAVRLYVSRGRRHRAHR